MTKIVSFSVGERQKAESLSPLQIESNGIHTQHLRDYIPKKYEFIKLRLNFLGWEVDIELLEVFAGASVWIIMSDILNLIHIDVINNIYELLFFMLPRISWVVVGGAIGFVHLVSILLDRSSEPGYKASIDNCIHLRIRSLCMLAAFLFDFCITSSIWISHSYALAWKLMALFTFAAFFSHIRLRKCYTRLLKEQRKSASVLNTSNRAG